MVADCDAKRTTLAKCVILTGIFGLLAFLAVTTRSVDRYPEPSARYRMHALPVAVSHLYLGHTHDYTGFRSVADDFHDHSNDLDELLAKYAKGDAHPGSGIYYWAADDRGLADYCELAFRLFGPRIASLADLHLLLLAATVGLFLVGYSRNLVAWLLPLFALAGHVLLGQVYPICAAVPLADGTRWLEHLAPYDSRVFEALAALPWFHLALLAALPQVTRAAWLTAVPQAAVMLFLLHARSTIGWEFLALVAIAGATIATRLARGRAGVWRATVLLGMVGVAVVGLKVYQRATFHAAYSGERGHRTFWHNALIGFTADPAMRQRYQLAIDDDNALQWVIRASGNDRWSTQKFIVSSLGGDAGFDWLAYEEAARQVYFGVWRDDTLAALRCHAYAKPKVMIGQVARAIAIAVRPHAGILWGWLAFTVAILLAGVMAVAHACRVENEPELRIVFRVAMAFFMASLIPGLAFYASVATMSGVVLGGVVLGGVAAVAMGRALRSRSARALCQGVLPSTRVAFALSAALVGLVALLFATDRRLELYESASGRYRIHAIPVALSVLHHQRPHDYTAIRPLAMIFQNDQVELNDKIRAAMRATYAPDAATYYWVADDRGLADYVFAAFRIFGPRVLSLSKFYFLLLGLSVLLFIVGYWQSPAVLLLPAFALLAWLGIAQVLIFPLPFPNAQGEWAERIALYESRMFDVLALTAVLHLAVLVMRPSPHRAAWFTAVLQAALLLFLYHARSSLGWQYLALFSLCGLRVAWWLVARCRSPEAPRVAIVAPAVFVATLLMLSLASLKHYQRVAYHAGYREEFGQRTFWHNALMGLQYHPRLRDELPMPLCEDRAAIDLVLHTMQERNPELDLNQWNWMAALNSLGNHNGFDWVKYEATARAIYLESWRDRPTEMAACYGYYKPLDIANQAMSVSARLGAAAWSGAAWHFLIGLALVIAAMRVAVVHSGGRFHADLAAMVGVVTVLLPFSLIPGIAFYPALTTVACFYLLITALAGVLVMYAITHRKGKNA